MEKQRILITVKTYPTISTKYAETVCTAGIKEDGSWVRIYPIPFRGLDENQQYKKYDWIECQLRKSEKDHRPESFNLVDREELVPIDHLGTDSNGKWRERRCRLLQPNQVYERLEPLISDAHNNIRSLATFKPSKIIDFVWKEEDRVWDPKKLQEVKNRFYQKGLFENNDWQDHMKIVNKLPYGFSYVFEDKDGRKSQLKILDWEIGALYWNCLKHSTGHSEQEALYKVRDKYLNEFKQKDLHFFLGTTMQFQQISPNPWLIIGVFYPPRDDQLSLFD